MPQMTAEPSQEHDEHPMKKRTLSALVVLMSPVAKIPGTKMIFAGIKNENETNDLRAFLTQYDKGGTTR